MLHRSRLRPAAVLFLVTAALSAALMGAPASAQDGERPVVRVGTEGTYPPFTFVDPATGDLTGYDVEVVQAVAERAGWEIELVPGQFDALFPALDAGRLDTIANQVTINPEREAKYAFSTPYTYSRGVIVTAAGTDDITTLDDLRGRTTAQSSTSNWAQVARDAGAEVETVEDFSQAADLLAQGRVDAIVNDNLAVLDYLATTGSDDVRIAGEVGGEASAQALAFRLDDADLADQADQALADLTTDGTLAEISERYFGVDVSVEGGADVDELEGSDDRSTWSVVRDAAGPMALAAIKVTIPLTAISFAIGLLLALAAALARLSSIRPLDWIARFYISAIRGTPLLVQLLIVFFGLPQLGIDLPSFPAACLALSLNVGGYAAEIIRASILSVPRGQFEAATTIGMGYAQGMRRIILPQASRIAVPPLSNTLLSLVKDTSLVSVVLVTDILRVARDAAGLSFEYLPLYTLAALYFWIICFLLSLVQGRLERRLSRYAT